MTTTHASRTQTVTQAQLQYAATALGSSHLWQSSSSTEQLALAACVASLRGRQDQLDDYDDATGTYWLLSEYGRVDAADYLAEHGDPSVVYVLEEPVQPSSVVPTPPVVEVQGLSGTCMGCRKHGKQLYSATGLCYTCQRASDAKPQAVTVLVEPEITTCTCCTYGSQHCSCGNVLQNIDYVCPTCGECGHEGLCNGKCCTSEITRDTSNGVVYTNALDPTDHAILGGIHSVCATCGTNEYQRPSGDVCERCKITRDTSTVDGVPPTAEYLNAECDRLEAAQNAERVELVANLQDCTRLQLTSLCLKHGVTTPLGASRACMVKLLSTAFLARLHKSCV